MSEEPLYCPFCGTEDYGCYCDLSENNKAPIKYCEVCGVELPCSECGS